MDYDFLKPKKEEIIVDTRRVIAWILTVGGVILLALFALADVINVGQAGVGAVQIGGMVVGIIIAIIGVMMLRSSATQS